LSRERLGVDAAEKGKDLTYLNRYPDFGVALTNNRPRSEMIGPQTWDLMLEVNIPLQQSSRRAQEREAGYRLDAARERVAAAEARLNGRLGETLDAAQAGYESGRVNFNTLIEAERQILRARLALLDAEVDANIRQAELEQLVGAPL
jgi:outer membrane protein TolC